MFSNDDVHSLFSDEFEVIESLVRSSSLSPELQLRGATVNTVTAQQVIAVALFLVIPILLAEASILPSYQCQNFQLFLKH